MISSMLYFDIFSRLSICYYLPTVHHFFRYDTGSGNSIKKFIFHLGKVINKHKNIYVEPVAIGSVKRKQRETDKNMLTDTHAYLINYKKLTRM